MSVLVKLPDGSQKELPDGAQVIDVARSIGEGLARAALAGKIDGRPADLSAPLPDESEVAILTWRDDEGKLLLRHTAAHILAMAVKRLWPQACLEDGPPTETGFFYDIEMPESVGPEALDKIEAEMKKIVKENLELRRVDLGRDEAVRFFAERGEKFKVETIEALPEDAPISIYEMGEFADLCRGPHLPRTGIVKAIKVMNLAGAYRKGDSTREQLVRFHAVAFPDKKELKQYLHLLEEAKKRDHRKIGTELDLFSFHEEGPGFPFFHARGTLLYNTLLDYIRAELDRRRYVEIRTPTILNEELWHRSGHWDNYRENMYFTDIDERSFAVKPMNCPGGLLVWRNKHHSYRELPMRVAEFGQVHRHEMSGVLHGLFRVRCFTQDDAHVFCTPEQVPAEVAEIIDLILTVYNTVGFENVHIELSTRPDKSIGTDEVWEMATESLKQALAEKQIDYQLNPGDGAFYGPKIDFHIKDCLGRSWQCGTIQVDFSMPERFDLDYVGPDGEKHRPVMIHRAVFGSIERFLGILIEHFAGNFPLWLAPEQARVLTLSPELEDYGRSVLDRLRQAGLRAELDASGETIGNKIRLAETGKIPVMLVVGKKEAEAGQVALRRHGIGDQGALPLDDCIEALRGEIADKALPPAAETSA